MRTRSHFHLDHTGDPTTFPGSTELIVGQGFKEAFVSGFPSNPKSPVLEKDYQGRTLRQINFDDDDNTSTIGGMPAFDFFGDGSFYLLHAPGVSTKILCPPFSQSMIAYYLFHIKTEPLTTLL